jgi:hypothetical protein
MLITGQAINADSSRLSAKRPESTNLHATAWQR